MGWTSARNGLASDGQKYFEQAGVSDKIEVIIGDAMTSMERFIKDGHAETFDYIFIDADKQNLDAYYELGLQLLRQGGSVLVDNTLWLGRTYNKEFQDEDTTTIRNLNTKMHLDERIQHVLIPLGDGIHMGIKK
jgi:caffeoyl-CoA O-methyltransferase